MLPLPASAVRTTGDVTGDGLDDLILATTFDSPLQEFRAYRALPAGGYDEPVVYYRPPFSNQTAALAVGDFNSDGRGDLALGEARNDAGLHLYFQDEHGRLVSSMNLPAANGSGPVLATDLDRDGLTDLAIAHNGWGNIGYYLAADSGFTPENLVNAYQFMGRLGYFAAGDLNGDGCGDLVVSRWTQSLALVYGQNCAAPRFEAPACRYPADVADGPGPSGANPFQASPTAPPGSGGFTPGRFGGSAAPRGASVPLHVLRPNGNRPR